MNVVVEKVESTGDHIARLAVIYDGEREWYRYAGNHTPGPEHVQEHIRGDGNGTLAYVKAVSEVPQSVIVRLDSGWSTLREFIREE